ncbi:MAG: DUF1015 domain-containing protein [Hyphomicrobiaceae bacterium]
MPFIRPFRALRPAPSRAGEIIAPPYDVLSSAEARLRAQGKPWSFLHISKPEIDLDPGIDPYAPAVYAKAAENLARAIAAGVLIRDSQPCYYVYRLTGKRGRQTGLAALTAPADGPNSGILRHELTTPVKEDDRTRQIEAVNAQTGPVMMAYPSAPALDALLASIAAHTTEVDAVADDGVRHELWTVADASAIADFTRAAAALPALYIADGHHRAAAAARVSAARSGRETRGLLAVLFPHHEMTILDYNRAVRDLGGRSIEQFLTAVAERFTLTGSSGAVRPTAATEFGMYLSGRWYKLRLGSDRVPHDHVIGRLPVALLDRHLIEPILGITDPRLDKRIEFVGGGRGLAELETRVKSGEMAVAFALFPTQMSDLMAVADAGKIMPPKSTWFEPKLADGLLSHVLDEP